MKFSIKRLSLVLAALLLLSGLVACGEKTETESQVVETESNTIVTETEKTDEFGRPWIEDSVPTDVNYENTPNNTITFFVREDDFYRTEIDVDAITGGFNLQAAWTMAWVVAKAI